MPTEVLDIIFDQSMSPLPNASGPEMVKCAWSYLQGLG
jgi:hypothetical protein